MNIFPKKFSTQAVYRALMLVSVCASFYFLASGRNIQAIYFAIAAVLNILLELICVLEGLKK